MGDRHSAVQHRGACGQPRVQGRAQQCPMGKNAGLRQQLVHYYDGTNWMVIYAIIYNVLLKFLEEWKQL